METKKNIKIAFILNLGFSIFEFIGGIYTGSVAILSDSLHDIGDALSIGIAYLLEKKSNKKPDEKYTYGYARFSVLGSIITCMILIFGSLGVIYNAIYRIINPTEIKYNGMLLLAVVGVLVNSGAVFFTRKGDSLNQKAVNLHMLEDTLGWAVVLIGGVLMRITHIKIIDPILSISIAIFITISSVKNLAKATCILLEKSPDNIKINSLENTLLRIDGIIDVHHIHLWSIDSQQNYATMHIVTDSNPAEIKKTIRKELFKNNIYHSTLEIEATNENCNNTVCHIEHKIHSGHHH